MAIVIGLLFWLFVLAMIKPAWFKISSRKRVLKWTGIIFGILIAVFVAIGVSIEIKKTPEERAKEKEARAMKVIEEDKKKTEEENQKNDTCLNYDQKKTQIVLMAFDAVRQGLKNPNGADFPSAGQANFIVSNDAKLLKKDDSKCAFVVSSYVDATNGFGAVIRTPWIVEIHSDGRGYSISSVIVK